MEICFLHGLDSSPHGTKGRLLRRHYPRAVMPVLPPGLWDRLETTERALAKGGPYLIVGTSLGGLTALQYAMRHPEKVRGLLLLAPAVGARGGTGLFSEAERAQMESAFVPRGVRAVIILGKRDEVVPPEAVRAMVACSPGREGIEILEVDDDHDLHASLHLMLEAVKGLLRGADPRAG